MKKERIVPAGTRSLLLSLLAVVGYVTGLDWGKFAKCKTKNQSQVMWGLRKRTGLSKNNRLLYLTWATSERDRLVESEITTSQPKIAKYLCPLTLKTRFKSDRKVHNNNTGSTKKIALFLNFAMRVSCVKSWRCGWEGVKVSQAHDYETVLWRQCVSTGYSLFRWTANGTVPKTLGGQVQWKVSFSEKER